MKLPLRIKETLYHDNQTGKPVGSEYWIFDDAAEELFVINDDEDAARRIVACVNACAGMDTAVLEVLPAGKIATLKEGRDSLIVDKMALMMERDRLRREKAELVKALSDAMNALTPNP